MSEVTPAAGTSMSAPSDAPKPAEKQASTTQSNDTTQSQQLPAENVDLSPAERKRLAKEAKAARRKEVTATKGAVASGAAPPMPGAVPQLSSRPGPNAIQSHQSGKSSTPSASGSAKLKGKSQDSRSQGPTTSKGNQKATTGPAATITTTNAAALTTKDPRAGIPDVFSHLPMARRITYLQADKDVDPAMLILGQQIGTFVVKDSLTRLHAMLNVLIKVRLARCYQ